MRILGIFIVCLLWSIVFRAQDDPVLMRVNGKEVRRSEFENLYGDYLSCKLGHEERDSLFNAFIIRELKVSAAEAAGIDTLSSFRNVLEAYRRSLSVSLLTDSVVLHCKARAYYDALRKEGKDWEARVACIYKHLPQNVTSTALKEAIQKMDSVYGRIVKTPEEFEICLKAYSDEPEQFLLRPLQYLSELENTVCSLKAGEISAPFFTPSGLYIAKVYDKTPLPPFAEIKEELIRINPHWLAEAADSLTKYLKQKHGFRLNAEGYRELLSHGHTSHTLFTLDGKKYDGVSFSRFLQSHPLSINKAFELFVTKNVLACESACLEEKYPGFKSQIHKFRTQLLIDSITARELPKPETIYSDETGLKAYFEAHQQHYYWDKPRYRGIVLHCENRRTARRIRKLLKSLPENEWMDAIRLIFNNREKLLVHAEQAVFSPGDNPYVDERVFKQGSAPRNKDFPTTILLGRKMKGPDNYWEVKDLLAYDYRCFLEEHWEASLRASGKVEINEEVLKTVNGY